MIDTDKMRAAYAATPLCQKEWTKKDDGNSPTMLCAISAMVSFAGVQPDLIHKMVTALGASTWFSDFASPVLQAEYGMDEDVASKIPDLFDKQENEWRGVQAVLDMCEHHNAIEMYEAAIAEDRERFPQYGPATSDRGRMKCLSIGNMYSDMYSDMVAGMYKTTWSATFPDWNATTTQVVKKAPKKVPESAPLPMLVAKTSGFLAIGEAALDEYWKLSGHAPPLWTANVMPGIAKEFGMPTLIHEPTLTEMKKLAVP